MYLSPKVCLGDFQYPRSIKRKHGQVVIDKRRSLTSISLIETCVFVRWKYILHSLSAWSLDRRTRLPRGYPVRMKLGPSEGSECLG